MGNPALLFTPQAARKIAPLGVTAPEQALLYLPSAYTDYSTILDRFPEDLIDTDEWVCLKIRTIGGPFIKSDVIPKRISFSVTDGVTQASMTIFGLIDPWKAIEPGWTLFVRCKLKRWNEQLQISSPERIEREYSGKVIPNYRGKKGVCSAEWLVDFARLNVEFKLNDAVKYIRSLFGNVSETEILRLAGINDFQSIGDIIRTIHCPSTVDDGHAALTCAKRIAAAHIVHEGQNQRHKKPCPASYVPIDPKKIDELIGALPFKLTEHQSSALNDIVGDLASTYPMFRLLSGDVNTGKTLVFGLAAALTHLAGKQAVILTPNILLARQIAGNLKHFFKGIPIVCVDGSAKKQTLDLTDKPVVVGTTAIFSRLNSLNGKPDLLVVDEQQKLSREQREKLSGEHTNILEATATCIPRTAALVSHGGMDYSVIDQSPVARKVISRVVLPEEKPKLADHIRRVVEQKGQVAIIYPAVTLKDGNRKKSVDGTAATWERLYPGRTAVLHGKMSDEEKQAVINGMMERKYDVLVSTIILEVGLTLPSLKALVVVEADRFGLSQLHQLRGRVARAGGTGYFFALLPEGDKKESEEHLRLLEENSDGYALAERDLELRGFGDLSTDGANQHGKGLSKIFVGMKLPYDTLRQLSEKPF